MKDCKKTIILSTIKLYNNSNSLGSKVYSISIWGQRLMTYYYRKQSQKFKKAGSEENGTEIEIDPLVFDIVFFFYQDCVLFFLY